MSSHAYNGSSSSPRGGEKQADKKGKKGKQQRKRERGKSRQHPDFPGGHPPQYYPSLRLLNFAERTGYGVLSLRWPSTSDHNTPVTPKFAHNALRTLASRASSWTVNIILSTEPCLPVCPSPVCILTRTTHRLEPLGHRVVNSNTKLTNTLHAPHTG